jgi:hypothetical protein
VSPKPRTMSSTVLARGFLDGETYSSGKLEEMKNEHSINTLFHQHLNANEAIGGNGNLGSIHLEIDVFFERVSEKNKSIQKRKIRSSKQSD